MGTGRGKGDRDKSPDTGLSQGSGGKKRFLAWSRNARPENTKEGTARQLTLKALGCSAIPSRGVAEIPGTDTDLGKNPGSRHINPDVPLYLKKAQQYHKTQSSSLQSFDENV